MSPTSCEVVAATGTVPWINPADARASDGDPESNTNKAYASIGSIGSETTHYLKCTGFGFTIPTRSTIDGITVEWEQESDTAGVVSDNQVRIVKGGAISSAENKALGASWPTSDAYQAYGGAADLWSETWNVGDINDTGFGVAISATASAAAAARVDHVQVTIDYTVDSLSSPDPGVECADLPESGCSQPDGGSLLIMANEIVYSDTKDFLLWKFKDSRTSVADFFNPDLDTNYILCLYDTTGGAYRLAIDKGTEPSGGIAVPAGSEVEGQDCTIKRSTGETGDCWTMIQRYDNPPTGYRYRDRVFRTKTPDRTTLTNGVSTLWLRANRQGATFGGTVFFRAFGPNLPMPDGAADPLRQLFDQQNEVLVQLVNSDGMCWQASYSYPPVQHAFRFGHKIIFRDNE